MTTLSFINNIVKPNFDMGLIAVDTAEVRSNLITPSANNSLFQRIFGQTLTSTDKYNYFDDINITVSPAITLDPKSIAINKGLYQTVVSHDFYGNAYIEQSPTIGPIQHIPNDEN